MNNEISHSKIMSALDWGYDKSANGIPSFESADVP